MTNTYNGRVTVVDHPLVHHKLSVLRDKDTPCSVFRQTVNEIALLEGYEATKHLKTASRTVETPIATTAEPSIYGLEPVIVPILRAGLGLLNGMLELVPEALVAHLGMYRDETTHEPIEYYAKMPGDIDKRQVIVVDPMLATGGSLIAAIQALRARGVDDLVAMVMVAAPEGIEKVLAADADVRLFTCAIDDHLNEDAYIVPGLGDAGDRIFNSFDTPVQSSLHQIAH